MDKDSDDRLGGSTFFGRLVQKGVAQTLKGIVVDAWNLSSIMAGQILR